jgi:hypothetical protein
MFLYLLLCLAAFSKTFDVYIAPIQKQVYSTQVEAIIGKTSSYGYSTAYWRNAYTLNERGTKEIISLNNVVRIYNEDTIKYAYRNCDYLADHKVCANQNDHYVIETFITVDDHEIVVQMILYAPNMTVINTSSVSEKSSVHWIRQQEVTVIQTRTSTITHMPKEELPLKWLIPANLMNEQIRRATAGLWAGVTL